jgi:hypothetical protein
VKKRRSTRVHRVRAAPVSHVRSSRRRTSASADSISKSSTRSSPASAGLASGLQLSRSETSSCVAAGSRSGVRRNRQVATVTRIRAAKMPPPVFHDSSHLDKNCPCGAPIRNTALVETRVNDAGRTCGRRSLDPSPTGTSEAHRWNQLVSDQRDVLVVDGRGFGFVLGPVPRDIQGRVSWVRIRSGWTSSAQCSSSPPSAASDRPVVMPKHRHLLQSLRRCSGVDYTWKPTPAWAISAQLDSPVWRNVRWLAIAGHRSCMVSSILSRA